MTPFGRGWQRLFRRDVRSEVEEELDFHVAMRARELEANGWEPAAARREARRRFGNVQGVAAECGRIGERRERGVRRTRYLAELRQDVRHAIRQFGRSRGFAAITVLTLGLGIAAATTMFSAVDAALLRPLPFARPDRLVQLPDVNVPFRFPGMPERSGPRSVSIDDVRAMPETFSGAAAYAAGGLNLTDPDHPTRLKIGVVTAGFFRLLGIPALRGRTFSPEEGAPGNAAVAILSYGAWHRLFGGGDVLGRDIRMNQKPYTVIGVMPRGFTFPSESDVWIPLTVPATWETFEAFDHYLSSQVIARLADGVSADAAAARLHTVWERFATGDADFEQTVREELSNGRAARALQSTLAASRRTALLVLLGATGLLLLIACANVANLLLSRAAARTREIAMRTVLGATPRRLMRQLMTESGVLALAAAAFGVAMVPVLIRVIAPLMPPTLVGLASPGIDYRVLAFAVGVTVACTLVFGLWPAFHLGRRDANETLKSGAGRGTTGGGVGRTRRLLVAAELTLTLLLLTGAGLMLQSLVRLTQTPMGVRTHGVATVELASAPADVVHAALERLRGEPGILAAGAVNELPIAGDGIAITIEADGVTPPSDGEARFARYLVATDGYFQSLGIPVVHGRAFDRGDAGAGRRIAVVNERLARDFWGDTDPVGRVFRFGGDSIRFTVIGVVGDVRDTPEEEPIEQMYFPLTTQQPHLALVARGTLSPAAMLNRLREAVHTADPGQATFNARMMDDVFAAKIAPRRTNTMLIAAFGLMALLLAALGVYGVVSYSVSQRTPELGIRAALGATGGALVRMLVGEMFWVSAVALAAGWAAAWAGARIVASLLYGVTAHDLTSFIGAPVVLLVVVLFGTMIPARRARRLDPMEVIRVE